MSTSDTQSPGFLGLASRHNAADPRGVVILPLPLDLTASWKRGTAEGPRAIVDASLHIEHFDDELDIDIASEVGGISTLVEPELPTDPELACRAIEALANDLVQLDRMLVSLGGEHSITPPLVRAHRALWPDLCVVQIDAHADIRDTYKGSRHNHACPMRRLVESGIHVTGVGIRSLDGSEREFVSSQLSRMFLATEVAGRLAEHADRVVASLPSRHVYLSVDLDGLDPSVVPAVGTPVPGGLGWYETMAFLRTLATSCRIVGADVVELSPREGLHAADAAAARLVYKLIGYARCAGVITRPGSPASPGA